MPSKPSYSKGSSAKVPVRPTRITQWQQRALDNGRTPLPEAPGLRPWLKEQSSDGAAVTVPVRALLRPLAPAPTPALAPVTTSVTPKSTQMSSTTTEGSAEP
ncbi:hypothetical protein BKA59DRAFT_514042 [Fusarium tricinctum]|uniref:Uncharacterized protein n=1 Tax=Fusarium tricinctum TaxID=61284 RepID=A0A8K0WB53_9HYPO|nr:hypothetical protein BKA59DRAFT_514042 [Fusarium tricinctum]